MSVCITALQKKTLYVYVVIIKNIIIAGILESDAKIKLALL